MSTTTDTYTIPEGNFAAFSADLAKLAKRADKLGVPAPSFTVVGEDTVPVRTDDGTDTGRVMVVYVVEVTGEAPKFDGWSLLAVIDRDLEVRTAPNIVNTIDGAPMDEAWRTVGDICDHCHRANTGRKKLVVVEHDNGDRMIVGSTCLKDFLGHKCPQAIAAWAELIATLDDRCSDYEEWSEGAGEFRCAAVWFIANTIKVIGIAGWKARGNARDFGGRATADLVSDVVAGCGPQARRILEEAFGPDLFAAPSDDMTAQAEQMIAWASEVDGSDNDYLLNLQAVALKSSYRAKDFGLAASIVPAFERACGDWAEAVRRADQPCAPVVCGKGVTVEGEVLSTKTVDGDYGVTFKMLVLDARGFKVWSTIPAAIDVERGDVVRFVANVDVSRDDPCFGFASRPRRAEVLTAVAA